MLDGALRLRLGEETFEVGAGGGVPASRGIPHAYGNARRGQMARYLLVMTPKIRALIQAFASGSYVLGCAGIGCRPAQACVDACR